MKGCTIFKGGDFSLGDDAYDGQGVLSSHGRSSSSRSLLSVANYNYNKAQKDMFGYEEKAFLTDCMSRSETGR